MKKFLLIFILVLSARSFAQTYEFYQTDNIHNKLRLNTNTGEVVQIQDDGQKFNIQDGPTPKNEQRRYRLVKTQNMWTYILLDEFFGKLWQCQFSVKGDSYMGCLVINVKALSTSEKRKFTTEPLASMYQFYLVNQDDGEMWKFQWNTKGDEFRWIEKM